MTLTYDLHIHSCLSPCGDKDMTPANIASMAKLAGLQVIAVSDHNSCLNCPAAQSAAQRAGLLLIPAMELTTSEEVHVLCLLPGLDEAMSFSALVRRRLPEAKNKEEIFGAQLIMDDSDRVIAKEDALLIGATSIGLYEVTALLEPFGGMAIPAHIDRPSFSLLSNLGFYDSDMRFTCMEITGRCDVQKLRISHPELTDMAFITNSDAHYLDWIPDAGPTLETDEASPAGVLRALRKLGG